MKDEEIIGLYWDRNQKAIPATDAKYGKLLKIVDNDYNFYDKIYRKLG